MHLGLLWRISRGAVSLPYHIPRSNALSSMCASLQKFLHFHSAIRTALWTGPATRKLRLKSPVFACGHVLRCTRAQWLYGDTTNIWVWMASGALLLGSGLLVRKRVGCETWPGRQWIHWHEPSNSTVRVLTWNVLTDQVVKAQNELYVKDYETNPVAVCMWESRLPLIASEVAKQSPDVIALQEVSQRMWKDLSMAFKRLGYDGVYKGYLFGWVNAEYGVALFWRAPWMAVACNATYIAEHETFLANCPPQYQQQPHWVVAASLIGPGDNRLAISSVHPTWKGPEQVRIAQALSAITVARETCKKAGWNVFDVPLIICGDFNTISDTKKRVARGTEHYAEGPVMHTYLTSVAGFRDALTDKPGFAKDERSSFTFAIPPGRKDEVIDFMFHSPTVLPVGCLQLDHDETMQGRPYLPHAHYPSDHVHLVCDFEFRQTSP